MDPLYAWARRDSSTDRELAYDQRFVYVREHLAVTIGFNRNENRTVYAHTPLIDFYSARRRELFVPAHEVSVFDRANPFSAVPRILAQVTSDNPDLLFLTKIFGLRSDTRVVILNGVTIGPQMSTFMLEHLTDAKLPRNFIIGVDNVLTEIGLHFAYLLSKLYSRITLLQPAISSQRYLVCMGFVGFDLISREDIASIANQNRVSPLSGFFTRVPDAFKEWLTVVNNVHLGILAENLVNLIESKKAFDRGQRYWPNVSYDMKRVVNFLTNQPTSAVVIRPKGLKVSKVPDEKFVFGLHLYGEPDDFTGVPLHKVLDFETDKRLIYAPSQDRERGGIHWGQRKLLLSEVDFFTSNIEKGEKSIAFYIGAAPFEHGAILSKWFPKLNFWLCDPRNVWSPKLGTAISEGKVLTTTAWFDLEFAEKIAALLKGDIKGTVEYLNAKGTDVTESALSEFVKDVKNFFFLSDIRSTDPASSGKVQHELSVHEDMQLQLRCAQRISDALPPGVRFMSSLKFRLPFIPEIGGADYTYGKGTLHTQPWSRMASTELRLWHDPKEGMDTYNKIAVEEIMMYHNNVLRSCRFGKIRLPNGDSVAGYCECHDCHYEVSILSNFLTKFRTEVANPLGQLKAYVDLMDSDTGFGMTLEAKSTDIRLRGGKFYLASKFSPLKELDRATLYYKTREQLELLAGITKEQVDAFTLYRIYTNATIDSDRSARALSRIAGIEVNKVNGILTQFAKVYEDAKTKMEARWARYKDPEPTLSINKLAGNKGFYNITAQLLSGPDQKPQKNSTIGFHKSLLRRFLIKMERYYDLTDRDLMQEPVVLARAYAILKRFGTLWIDHFALSLDSIYNANEELPGMLNGGSVLSAKEIADGIFEEKYTATFPDLELDFADHTSVFALDPENRIVPSSYVTVFYPDIEPIWSEAADLWKDILRARSPDQPLAVVFVVPSDLANIVLKDAGNLFRSNNEFKGRAFDSMKNAEVTLAKPHSVIVLATQSSEFAIKL